MSSKRLNAHVYQTYTSLRAGMGVIAFLLPIVLFYGGKASDTHLQGSFCAYYHTPMRNFFVGILFALGAFLYLYKGFSRKEDYALNMAGVLAVLVAVVPMDGPSDPPVPRSPTAQWHNVFSALFLLTVAYVCIFRSADTLPLIESRTRANFYYYAYKLIGVCIAVAPVVVYILAHRHQRAIPPDKKTSIFVAETVTIWTFSLYWLLKTKEITDNQGDQGKEIDEVEVARPIRPVAMPVAKPLDL